MGGSILVYTDNSFPSIPQYVNFQELLFILVSVGFTFLIPSHGRYVD